MLMRARMHGVRAASAAQRNNSCQIAAHTDHLQARQTGRSARLVSYHVPVLQKAMRKLPCKVERRHLFHLFATTHRSRSIRAQAV